MFAAMRRFVLVMAAGSLVGSFIGGRLLGLVPTRVLVPLLAVIFGAFSGQGLAGQIAKCRIISITQRKF